MMDVESNDSGGKMTKTDIPIGKILEDMRSGLGDVPIMEKYQISPTVLLKIRQGLTRIPTEPKENTAPVRSKTDEARKRVLPRNHTYYRIPIRELKNPENVGTINDITNRGLQLQGIAAGVGEKLTLLVLADSFRVHTPFVFEAECRWTDPNAEGYGIAGFSITNISGPDLQELRKLIAELTVVERA
jgi:hypothetical protein